MPFSFTAVELCVVTINEKPWTRAKKSKIIVVRKAMPKSIN